MLYVVITMAHHTGGGEDPEPSSNPSPVVAYVLCDFGTFLTLFESQFLIRKVGIQEHPVSGCYNGKIT